MSAWKTLLLLFAPALAGHGGERLGPEDPLRELRWQNRLVVGRVDKEEAGEILKTIRGFAETEPDPWAERKLRLFLVLPDGSLLSDGEFPQGDDRLFPAVTARLPTRDGHRFSLIGLDGKVKDTAPDLDFGAWFDRIDQMPMRAAELEGGE